MNKGFIIDFLLNKSKEDDTIQEELIEYIEEAKLEMEIANSMFQNVSEPKLIEAAIYAEESAKKKYEYLLALAKERKENNKAK